MKNGFEYFKEMSNATHSGRYQYDIDKYVDMKTKTKILCPIHGEFYMIPDNHVSKEYGCPSCGRLYGKMEKMWLDSFNIPVEYRQYKIENFIVDGYDPLTNTIYEFNGDFFHGNPDIYNQNDLNPVTMKTFGFLYQKTINRELYLKLLGYNIVSIWESDYKKII